MMKRGAIFISGTGSNMATLLEKQNLAHISLVVSSNPNAIGLKKAKRRSIPALVFDSKLTPWGELIKTLEKMKIDFIVLAGFMKILPKEFVSAFHGRIFNIHPSLLPDYPGVNSIERAFNDKKNTGCSLHIVDEGVDTGKVLVQKKVSLEKSLEWTEMMVHIQEHKMIRRVPEISGGTV